MVEQGMWMMNTLSGGRQVAPVCLFTRTALGFLIPTPFAAGTAGKVVRPPSGNASGPGRVHPLIRAAGEMHFCLPEPWPESPGDDSGWSAYVWFRATRRGADREFQAGPARNPAPVRTGFEDDPTAIR